MSTTSIYQKQIKRVRSFEELLNTPYQDEVNALCWERQEEGNFEEIVRKLHTGDHILELSEDMLMDLSLTEAGALARNNILKDFKLLTSAGASPTLNLIRCYDSDKDNPGFPTDVYSFHADSSPIPTHTFLCTYYGAPSELLPNDEVDKKIDLPEIRQKLKTLYEGPEEDFESFLIENCFHLHYQPKPNAKPISMGVGQLWRLAVEYPGNEVKPCIHRAPLEANNQPRLLLIC